MPYLHTLPDGTLLLNLYVQPKASRNEFAGIHNAALKLRLTAAPVEGKANKAVVAFLAKTLKLAKSSFKITAGLQSRTKQVQISGLGETAVRQMILEATKEMQNK